MIWDALYIINIIYPSTLHRTRGRASQKVWEFRVRENSHIDAIYSSTGTGPTFIKPFSLDILFQFLIKFTASYKTTIHTFSTSGLPCSMEYREGIF